MTYSHGAIELSRFGSRHDARSVLNDISQDGGPPKGAQLMTLDHVCSATPVVRAPLLDIHDVWLGRACDQLAAARL